MRSTFFCCETPSSWQFYWNKYIFCEVLLKVPLNDASSKIWSVLLPSRVESTCFPMALIVILDIMMLMLKLITWCVWVLMDTCLLYTIGPLQWYHFQRNKVSSQRASKLCHHGPLPEEYRMVYGRFSCGCLFLWFPWFATFCYTHPQIGFANSNVCYYHHYYHHLSLLLLSLALLSLLLTFCCCFFIHRFINNIIISCVLNRDAASLALIILCNAYLW